MRASSRALILALATIVTAIVSRIRMRAPLDNTAVGGGSNGRCLSSDDSAARWQHSIDHGKASYANAQEVIRFVDSKTGIITGVVTVTTGIPLAIFHVLISRDADEAAVVGAWVDKGGVTAMLVMLCGFFLLLGFALGICSLVAATSGLMARRPRETLFRDDSLPAEFARLVLRSVTLGRFGRHAAESTPEVTCLFPLFRPAQRDEALHRFQRLGRGEYGPSDIAREYGLQLGSVGSILETKISRNRKAIQFFEGQILAYGCSVVLTAVLFVAWPPFEVPKDQWDPTAPGHARARSEGGLLRRT